MNERYIIGIDIGTTGTKAILFGEDGTPVAHAYRGYTLSTPAVGRSEHDAEGYVSAVAETVREVTLGRGVSESVAAIAFSTQGGTLIPVDEKGVPVRRAIVWNDHRCAKEKEAYLREVGDPSTLYRKTGWKLGTGLPLLTIRHLKDNEPDVFAKTARFLTVPDFVALRLSGKAAVDLSNAGINQLVDIEKKRYDEALLAFAGIKEEMLPALVPSGEVIAPLSKEGATLLGLSEKTLLVSGAHDQYAVALGTGANRAGDILIGSGTCWVVTAIGNETDFESNLAQSVAAVPGLFGSLSSLSSGGVCLEWLRKNVATADGEALIDFKSLDAEAEKRQAALDGLFFFPFSGKHEGGRFTKASFTGLDLSHDRFHMARAVMEGVVFQILWFMEAFKTQPDEKKGITLAGGASKSAVWTQMLADVSGLPVRIPSLPDLACVGAAILAGVGAGLYEDARAGYRRFAASERTVLPSPEAHEKYKAAFEAYKKQANAIAVK